MLPQLSDDAQDVDFFVADFVVASCKDDMTSMEHPFFALRAGDRTVRTYCRKGKTITIKPGPDGCATIHDKDVWIYCISKLIDAKNRGLTIKRVVHFVAYDFLVATHRGTGGKEYDQLIAALTRLKGTTVETNIETAGQCERSGFGLVDSWRTIDDRKTGGKMVAVEVVLPDWLFRSVEEMNVLTLSCDYFDIRKPLHRRLYEIARKHCGRQLRWSVNMETLHAKSGSRAPLRRFRFEVKALAKSGNLPDYYVVYNAARDTVMFYPWGPRGAKAQFDDIVQQTGKAPELPCG